MTKLSQRDIDELAAADLKKFTGEKHPAFKYDPTPRVMTPCSNPHVPLVQAATYGPDDRRLEWPLCAACATPLWKGQYR